MPNRLTDGVDEAATEYIGTSATRPDAPTPRTMLDSHGRMPRMQTMSDRQIVALTAFTTAVCAVMTAISTGGDWLTTALAIPVAAAAAFSSLRLMRRLMSRMAPPPGRATPAAPPRPLPSSERPEHAQRRRERRRPRGRNRAE